MTSQIQSTCLVVWIISGAEISTTASFWLRPVQSPFCHPSDASKMTGRSCNTVVRAALLAVWLAVFLACWARPTDARLAGECAMQCNDLRLEVLTLEICR
jgi:hypothetical protein